MKRQSEKKFVTPQEVAVHCHSILNTKKDWIGKFTGYADNIGKASRLSGCYIKQPFQQYTSVTNEGSFSYDLRVGGDSVATVKLKKDGIYLVVRGRQLKNAKNYYPELKEPIDAEWLDPVSRKFRSEVSKTYRKGNIREKASSPEHHDEDLLLKVLSRQSDSKLKNIQPIVFPGGFSHMPTKFSASNHEELPSYPGSGSIDIFARVKHKDGTPHLCVMELKDQNTESEPFRAVIAQATAYATFIAHLLMEPACNEKWWKIFMPRSKRPVTYFTDIDIVGVMPFREGTDDTVPVDIELVFGEKKIKLNYYSLFYQLSDDGKTVERFEGSFPSILRK